ncbi:MAG: rhodanese-like domain-containing protein [Pseudomonadota bacterium]
MKRAPFVLYAAPLAARGALLWDARDEATFENGHIPRAINIPFEANWIDPDKETIVYCQSGDRAAETAAVLADLGFRNIRVYDSSWLGYASVLTARAEDETWLNVGALQATAQSLEARIEELERRLAQRRP